MRQFALLPLIRRHLGTNSASAILGEAGSHPPKTQRDPPFALIRPCLFSRLGLARVGGRAGGHSAARAVRNGPRLIMSYATYAAAAAECE